MLSKTQRVSAYSWNAGATSRSFCHRAIRRRNKKKTVSQSSAPSIFLKFYRHTKRARSLVIPYLKQILDISAKNISKISARRHLRRRYQESITLCIVI